MAAKKIENQTLEELIKTKESMAGVQKGVAIVWGILALLAISYMVYRLTQYGDDFSRFTPLIAVFLMGTIVTIILPRTRLESVKKEISKRQQGE